MNVSLRNPRFVLLAFSVFLAGTLAAAVGTRSAGADTGLQVYAGYMDTHSGPVPDPGANPNPWPNTDPSSFIGDSCPGWPTSAAYNVCWDAASIRLVNPAATPVTGVTVSVVVGSKTYSPWGSFTVQANGQMVLTETSAGNMDLSDEPPNAYNGGGTASCADSGAVPQVNVTVAGVTTTYTDSTQVLNTGGVDKRHCVNGAYVSSGKNESIPWTQVFSGTPPVAPTTPAPATTTAPAPAPSCATPT